MNKDKYLTVSALTKYIKFKIDSDEHLKTVFLKGEISNFKMHSTGHLYFSIKDETSKINAIMFARDAKNITFTPQEGTKILVVGRISVYESTGNYQIYVQEMLEDGVGNLYIAFEKLKEKLSKEGLFDEKYKKKIPKIPKKIGIITAPTGAAIKDILSTIKRRFPICETILFPSLVQGEYAKEDIVKNIKIANTYDLDVIILGRGGGSIEDLWPFNEEIVAREIFSSNIPIISAVGHEVDFTIADFVADLRAPTPTGAAEMAVPNMIDIKNHIKQLSIRLNENISKKINIRLSFQNCSTFFSRSTNFRSVGTFSYITVTSFFCKSNYILKNPNALYKESQIKLKNLIEKLELVNPLGILKRGYSLTKQDNKVIYTIKKIDKTKPLLITLQDGIIETQIKNIKEDING